MFLRKLRPSPFHYLPCHSKHSLHQDKLYLSTLLGNERPAACIKKTHRTPRAPLTLTPCRQTAKRLNVYKQKALSKSIHCVRECHAPLHHGNVEICMSYALPGRGPCEQRHSSRAILPPLNNGQSLDKLPQWGTKPGLGGRMSEPLEDLLCAFLCLRGDRLYDTERRNSQGPDERDRAVICQEIESELE